MRIPLLAAAGLAAGLLAAPASAGGTSVRHDLDAVRAAGVTGAAAEVHTAHGRQSARVGVADLDSGRPVAPGSSVRYGSITKTYVAATVLSLVGDGRLRLDDTVERWLPGVVAGNGNDGRAITVRHLLRQTTGLYDYTWDLFADLDTPAEFRRNRWRDLPAGQRVAMSRPQPGDRPSNGVDSTTVVRVLTFAALRISCSSRSRPAGLSTRTSSR